MWSNKYAQVAQWNACHQAVGSVSGEDEDEKARRGGSVAQEEAVDMAELTLRQEHAVDLLLTPRTRDHHTAHQHAGGPVLLLGLKATRQHSAHLDSCF